ncbi:COMM domain-containing protein 4-like [Watersipora subatra]|uniref:COMM domain-containing protein 4-like n=1 Tax=Watersipora subatra TaxID=2589382 RepID=UPI00355BDF06
MRFRFCGGLDCPDWVLAEITILARMSSIKMKLLSGQVIKNLLGEVLDYEKVKKYTADAKYDTSDVKAAISVLTFILSSAARYDIESAPLSDELQQLGLPKEHSTSLCKLFADNSSSLQDHFRLKSLRLSQIEKVDYTVRHVLDFSGQQVLEEPIVDLTLVLNDPHLSSSKTVSFSMTSRKFQTFLHEMKVAKEAMASTSNAL